MSRHLQQIYAERFGGLVDREVGPFGPGLNVVFGPNEAGKSTLSALVGGVLFGWEDAHGVRNTFRPDGGGARSGRLTWSDAHRGRAFPDWGVDSENATSTWGDMAPAQIRRNEEGISGDLSVLEDIDRGTFEAVFWLRADELRALRGSSDVTARLLTAGSGTASSPASAFVEIERRIAGTPVYRLESELEEAQGRAREAAERERLHVQEDRELRELATTRRDAERRVRDLDAELEELIAWRAEVEAADRRSEQVAAELEKLQAERRVHVFPSREAGSRKGVLNWEDMDPVQVQVLRDKLDEFADERGKVSHAADLAKENSATSAAAYEALCELDEADVAEARRLRNRKWQVALAVLLPIAFVASGVPVFMHGRDISSLSFTTLGAFLVLAAVLLAAGAFVALLRQPPGAAALDSRRQDAQWVMLQDRKKLDACLADQAEFSERLAAFLEGAGLEAAEGSIRQARSLLDEADALRARRAEEEQRVLALDLRIRACEDELAELEERRERVSGEAGERPGRLAAGLAQSIQERSAEREALLTAAANMGERFGELTRELELARGDRTFDQAKLEVQQIRTQLREAKHELVTLLLAKRMLERSIAAWEGQSQPEVYAHAGRLLAEITGGRWVQVTTSATGSLVAVAADGTARDPRHLSLGTCQQLYLALRIALLITADDVGRAIPVLADDILVNFDAERRAGAARALAELARHRQVIVFTCHEATARVLAQATPDCERIDLMRL